MMHPAIIIYMCAWGSDPEAATMTSQAHLIAGIYILAISGKNLKEDLTKGREKGGKEEKKRVIKHTLKYLYEA